MNQQGAKAFPRRGSLPPHQGQTPVVGYFQAASSYWKSVYEEPTVKGLVYRERMATALRWIDELALPAGSRMLDAGCGAGLTTVSLARRGYQVDAIDAAQRMILLTRELAQENGVENKVTAQTGNVQELPYGKGTFALIVALGLLPWFPEPYRIVREIARVLQPGGYALLTADNRWCLNHFLDPGLNRALSLPRSAFHKIRRALTSSRRNSASASAPPAFRHSVRTVDKWVRESGLSKVRGTTLGFGPFLWFEHPFLGEEAGIRLHLRLQRLADRGVPGLRSSGWHYLVLAQKIMPEEHQDKFVRDRKAH